jgi:DNA-binding HxlR family transcriptional regulator
MEERVKQDLYGVCPFVTAQQLLSGRWALLVLHYLSRETLRFGQLQRAMPEMTQATLSKQLKAMEHSGLIVRTAYSQIPPRVEYSLSEMGRAFLPVLDALEDWGSLYIDYLKQAGLRSRDGIRGPDQGFGLRVRITGFGLRVRITEFGLRVRITGSDHGVRITGFDGKRRTGRPGTGRLPALFGRQSPRLRRLLPAHFAGMVSFWPT